LQRNCVDVDQSDGVVNLGARETIGKKKLIDDKVLSID
jgi:hypothetical protein